VEGMEVEILEHSDDSDKFSGFCSTEFLVKALSHRILQSQFFDSCFIDDHRGGGVAGDLRRKEAAPDELKVQELNQFRIGVDSIERDVFVSGAALQNMAVWIEVSSGKAFCVGNGLDLRIPLQFLMESLKLPAQIRCAVYDQDLVLIESKVLVAKKF